MDEHPDVEPEAVKKPKTVKPRAKAPAPAAAPAVKQPFRMSYDGTTDKDYIAHIVRLGAR